MGDRECAGKQEEEEEDKAADGEGVDDDSTGVLTVRLRRDEARRFSANEVGRGADEITASQLLLPFDLQAKKTREANNRLVDFSGNNRMSPRYLGSWARIETPTPGNRTPAYGARTPDTRLSDTTREKK